MVIALDPPVAPSAARPQAPQPVQALPADPLAGVPEEIRSLLRHGLLRTLDETVWDADGLLIVCRPTEEDLPERVCPAPFDLRLLRVEVRLALEALEVFLLTRSPARPPPRWPSRWRRRTARISANCIANCVIGYMTSPGSICSGNCACCAIGRPGPSRR